MRLKDEMKRTEDLGGANSVSGIDKAPAKDQPLQEQRVGAAAVPTAAPASGQQLAPAAPVTLTGPPADTSSASSQSVATAPQSSESKEENGNRVSIAPKFGTANIMSSTVNVSAKWGAG